MTLDVYYQRLTDRSIAIAHGLEDICEVEPPKKGKKRKKKKSEG